MTISDIHDLDLSVRRGIESNGWVRNSLCNRLCEETKMKAQKTGDSHLSIDNRINDGDGNGSLTLVFRW